MRAFLNKAGGFLKEKWKYLYVILCPFALLAFAYIQLETSSAYTSISEWLHYMSTKYALLNLFTIVILFFAFLILTNRIWLSGVLFCCIYSVIALVNHYCIVLHGLPFTVMELKNARTALNVIGAYKITLDLKAGCILLLWLLGVVVCIFAKKFEKACRIKRSFIIILLRDACMIALSIGVLYFGYFSAKPIKPRVTIGWMWSEAYRDYGYMACQIEIFDRSRNYLMKPEGYSAEKLGSLNIDATGSGETCTPDVIFILNETFYDLSLITELSADKDYLENIHTMDHVITGYAVVPIVGGGTNNSEYELLTSNSLYLMQGITPFNVIDMQGANSIVSHLDRLGYYTLAMHPGVGSSYQRSKAFSAMGFDEVHFIEDFTGCEYYKKREFLTDQSVYRNLIRWYENRIGEMPVFMYCLTIQNHGGWASNAKEDAIVHAGTDYGEYNAQIDEFLSCIDMADRAFAELTEYFAEADRPVIICMVGDHAPYIAPEIADSSNSEAKKQLYLRSVPFVIWSNFDMEGRDMGFVSMNYLASVVLKEAHIAVSPYYQYMLGMMASVPVLTSYGIYLDSEGNFCDIGGQTQFSELIDGYLYLEYNNLSGDKRQEFFEPYGCSDKSNLNIYAEE